MRVITVLLTSISLWLISVYLYFMAFAPAGCVGCRQFYVFDASAYSVFLLRTYTCLSFFLFGGPMAIAVAVFWFRKGRQGRQSDKTIDKRLPVAALALYIIAWIMIFCFSEYMPST